MAKTFEMKFEDYSYIIPKNMIKMHLGYGIIKVVFNPSNIDDEELELIGLVDKHFNTIIPLAPTDEISRISVLPNNNIVFMVNMVNDESDNIMDNEIYHFKIKEDGSENEYTSFKALDYVLIDADLIKLRFFSENIYTEQLYSVNNRKFIGSVFNRISNFDFNTNEETATATLLLPYDSSGVNMLICKINKNGEIISNIKDIDYGVIYDKSSDLEECIKDTLSRMNKVNQNKVRVLDKQ